MAHVLLVEDHPDTAAMMALLLERRRHRVTLARTRAELRARCRGGDIDVILLDLKVPDGSPEEMWAMIRHCGVRTIVCSAFGYEADVRASLAAGAEAHLTKPVDVRDLLRHIEQ